MRIGYPCINRSIGCTANSTFRLANYSKERLIAAAGNNLDCLQKILEFNKANKIRFFRISSDLVPFASHPVCKFRWQDHFKRRFAELGKMIKKNRFRISMHPDQFVLINAIKKGIVKRSIKELEYHCEILDLMGLDSSAKVQIHIGGVYGDRQGSMERFVKEYNNLPSKIKKRLVIENDDVSYPLADCLTISKKTGIPVLFDVFHHKCLNKGEPVPKALESASKTWKKKDGVLMVDYSSQKKDARKGTHTEHMDLDDFKSFIKSVKNIDFDIMLEIKDKEKSALKANECLASLGRD